MFFGVTWREALGSAVGAALSAVGPIVVSLVITQLLSNGSITYVTTENQNSGFVSVVAENLTSTPVDLRLYISDSSATLFSNNGLAGTKIETEPGRKGKIITLSGIPPRAAASLLVATTPGGATPELNLINSPSGFSVTHINKARSPYDWSWLIVQIIIYWAVIFLGYLMVERRLAAARSEAERLAGEISKITDKLENSTSKTSSRLARIKLYYGRITSNLAKENEFWRDIFRRILTNSGVHKGEAKHLLATISGRLGTKVQWDVDQADITELVDILIEENKRAQMDQIVRANVMRIDGEPGP